MEWQPVLTGTLRDASLARATALIRSLGPPQATDPRSACLSAGAAGIAVCHAVVARECQDGQARELALRCLDGAIEVLARQPFSMSLYSGFTGIAWAADLVDRLLPGECADRNGVIDEALAQAVPNYPATGPYDLIDGLTGLGVYALARWPRPLAAQCLAAIVAQLDARAGRDGDGAYWWTPAAALAGPRRQLYPDGGVDLGVAHGLAGVLPLLARAAALGVDAARPLLDAAARWLCAHLLGSPDGPTAPSFHAAGAQPAPARSAWCYGDPGVAMALLLAARELGEPGWQRTGTQLALRAARRAPGEAGVADAGLCHGTAGLTHLFARLYQLTGEPELAGASVAWARRTLAICVPGDGSGDGNGRAASPWTGDGLLEGAAGIALALLAGCLPAEPAWDQMLLVSTGMAAGVSAS